MEDIFTVDEVPGLSAGVYGMVYGRPGGQDSSVVVDQEHNITLTVVWSFNMVGGVMRPLLIEPQKVAPTKGTRSTNWGVLALERHDYLLWTATDSAYITSKVFLEYLTALREFVGHTRRLFLVSDGHASRTSLEVVQHAARLNIELFLLPPNTTHALAASDQFHQHLHRRRLVRERQLRFEANDSLSPKDKCMCLVDALDDCVSMVALQQAAWRHAGIDRAGCKVELMLNPPPAPEQQKQTGPGSRASSGRSLASVATHTPTPSELEELSPGATKRAARRMLRKSTSNTVADAAARAQREMLEERTRERRNNHLAKVATSQRVEFVGLLSSDVVVAALKERKEKKEAKLASRKYREAQETLAARMASHLGLTRQATGPPVKGELLEFLRRTGHAVTKAMLMPQLLDLTRKFFDDSGAAAEEDASQSSAATATSGLSQGSSSSHATVVELPEVVSTAPGYAGAELAGAATLEEVGEPDVPDADSDMMLALIGGAAEHVQAFRQRVRALVSENGD